MREAFKSSVGTFSGRRPLRFARAVPLRQPRPRQRQGSFGRTNGISGRLWRRGGFLSRASPPAMTDSRPFRWSRIGAYVRRTIAVATLLIGVVVVNNYPELLLPLLPVGALIVCELIFWSDSASQGHDESAGGSKTPSKPPLTNKGARV